MKRWRLIAIAAVAMVLAGAAFVYWRVSRVVHGSEEELRAAHDLAFSVRPFTPAPNPGFEWVSAPGQFTRAANFQGRLFVAGPASVVEYDARGVAEREYRVGLELPPSPIVAIAEAILGGSRQPELLLATADQGIVAFNGTTFRQIFPEEREARSITSLLPLSTGQLLIGTSKRGLLTYDGQRLQAFHPELAHIHITELAGRESDFWIGTQDRGVAHFHGGTVEWFDESQGLPDARIYSLAVAEDRAYAGTPAGIAEFEGGRFSRVIASGAFVRAMLVRHNTLLAATMEDGVLEIPLASPSRVNNRPDGGVNAIEAQQLFASGDSIYAVTSDAIYVRPGRNDWKRVLESRSGQLSDRNISALAVEANGRLWVGYFDRGLDIVDAIGRRTHHVENDHVFCVNRLLVNASGRATAVATANGLVLFDAQGNQRQVLGRNDGLIVNHVTDVVSFRDGMAIATPAGITFFDSAGARSLYAFQGLVNNHVYALAANGRQLLAGTLGGASLLEDDQIRANYTTATSNIKHNWITAAVATGSEWWLGTYGTGVVRMGQSGHFEQVEGASGDLVVNPNAMLAAGDIVLVGTMARGLYLIDRNTGRGVAVTGGLPSLNVTALATDGTHIYVGTDNGLVRIPTRRLKL